MKRTKGILVALAVMLWAGSLFASTVPEPSGGGYVGGEACAKCHEREAASHSGTPMANALSDDLASDRPLPALMRGGYRYEVRRDGGRALYTVSGEGGSISEPILYFFGTGNVGQTFVFRHDGVLYESRVSYYRNIRALDVTVGQEELGAGSVDEALGRRLDTAEAKTCFACHAPESVRGSGLKLEGFAPGVTCESCHGPGERHIAAVKTGKPRDLQISNPGRLNPLDLSQEFCGSCHTGFERALRMEDQGGSNNIRFQPYRIFNSPGHSGSDPRLSCVACHDPHEHLVRDDASYDANCLSCHRSSAKTAPTRTRAAPFCPVGAKDCVTCHMPKVELPGMHAKFTDHWIRIARPGDPVPK